MKLSNKLITILIVFIILIFNITFIFSKKHDFSSLENRYLEELPKFSFKELFDGYYIKSLENYINDHFPLRNTFMKIKTKTDKILGIKDINNVYLGKDYLLERYNEPKNSDKIIKKLDYLYSNLNYVNMNLMLVPTSISLYNEYLPMFSYIEDELESIKYIYDNIKFDSIDVYNTIKENSKYYEMYYKLDHHWTTYAAYYAYQEYCKTNNIDYISLNKFNIEKVTDSFRGTLYSKVLDDSYKPDSIHIFSLDDTDYTVYYNDTKKETKSLYDYSYLDKKDKYSMFLDNNHSMITITNNKINSKTKLLVIKDSYANSMIPFLVNHYKEVIVVDPRYYKKSIIDYVKDNDIKDILILYNIIGIDTDKGILGIK